MQAILFIRCTIRGCVINCNCAINLPTTAQVVQEARISFLSLDFLFLAQLLKRVYTQYQRSWLVTRILQKHFKSMLFCAHDFAQSCFEVSHLLAWLLIFVWVSDLKSHLLDFVEIVLYFYVPPIWIQVILLHFSLSNEIPFISFRILFMNKTDRVWNAEQFKILKTTCRDKKKDIFLLAMVNLVMQNVKFAITFVLNCSWSNKRQRRRNI